MLDALILGVLRDDLLLDPLQDVAVDVEAQFCGATSDSWLGMGSFNHDQLRVQVLRDVEAA